jgi:hypothetical protein
MIVFLDLEQTVINCWDDQSLILRHIEKIKHWLSENNLDVKLGLMSWAVWDENDKNLFNIHIRPRLEEALGKSFNDSFVLSMDDFASKILECCGKMISRDDMFDMFNKETTLFTLTRSHPMFKFEHVFLIDDAVEHGLNWESTNNHCHCTILNITKME